MLFRSKEVILEYEDLFGRVASLQKWEVIGRWMFPDNSEFDMSNWIRKYWNPIIGYTPKVSTLINGWFSIHFLDDKYVYKNISRTWVRGRSFM